MSTSTITTNSETTSTGSTTSESSATSATSTSATSTGTATTISQTSSTGSTTSESSSTSATSTSATSTGTATTISQTSSTGSTISESSSSTSETSSTISTTATTKSATSTSTVSSFTRTTSETSSITASTASATSTTTVSFSTRTTTSGTSSTTSSTTSETATTTVSTSTRTTTSKTSSTVSSTTSETATSTMSTSSRTTTSVTSSTTASTSQTSSTGTSSTTVSTSLTTLSATSETSTASSSSTLSTTSKTLSMTSSSETSTTTVTSSTTLSSTSATSASATSSTETSTSTASSTTRSSGTRSSSTTVTTASATSTTTRSSSTATSSTSSTATSTTRTTSWLPCRPGCEGATYFGCDEPLAAGRSCHPSKISSSPCISGVAPELVCPAQNLDNSRIPKFFPAIPDEDTPMIQCRVCGIGSLSEDESGVQGYYTGVISFGRNQMHGELNEEHVVGYNLYFVNALYEKVPWNGQVQAIQFVHKTEGQPGACCADDAYEVSVTDLELPYGEVADPSDLRIMVVAVDSEDVEMPVGPTQELPVDADEACPPPSLFLADTDMQLCELAGPGQGPPVARPPGATGAQRPHRSTARRLSEGFCTACAGMPLVGCTSDLSPGESCSPVKPTSGCVQGAELTLTCPAGHAGAALPSILYHEPDFPTLVCQVCGIGGVSEDADARAGYYDGNVSFGRNTKGSSQIDETSIKEYRVYFSDGAGNKDLYGGLIGSVSAASSGVGAESADCCDRAAYSVAVAGRFRPGFATHIMVVPVDTDDLEMPVGQTMAFVDAESSCVEPAGMLAPAVPMGQCPDGG
ncbi:unnamed protein product, partial [Prorocentrum cordatum]